VKKPTASGGANGPGTAWAIRSSHGGIVLALAVDLANGMNGRKIEDVKPHTRHIRETCLAILEGPVLARHRRTGAWKHLVPSAEAGLGTVHHHRELSWGGNRKTTVRIQGQEPTQELILQDQTSLCKATRLQRQT
jgi:hypothetical protein